MVDHMIILLRSISAFVILLIITRFLGKQTLSNMNFHEFVTAVILGAIAANFAFNEKMQVIHLLISLAVFTFTSYLLSIIIVKNRKFRMWTEGTPTILIEGGKILEDNLKKNHLTLDTLNQMLRQKDIFDYSEIEYALLEINGKISVMKKKEYHNVTLKDLKKGSKDLGNFPIELIMDGQLLEGNLKVNNIPPEWVMDKLTARGKQLDDVFYAVKGSNGQLYIDFYNDKITHPIDIE
ncbi:DUF421 domain-containing protein [Paenibacillus lactis]|uniref:Uncharacterized membrane protein YcaP (DUF421 family) n=1 Tax=Paenibacillus lactis TaxID=228574 RepID=A0ABS4F6V9_9BACL|nr:DUF421 domain-containing protein [Paenibacillus lactis]MBP1891994.1 uncharacterized membrane protein YcaP (DUF421 family) [Paenibacillus lactis]HAF99434.1 hypothetical protein [Paenibacillus lactis]